MAAQAEGLAEAIGWPFVNLVVRPRPPWTWLPINLHPPGLLQYGLKERLQRPWPELVISCGRRSAGVAAAVRRSSGSGTFAVHIQNPLSPLDYFDLVVPPCHDNLAGPNVLATRAALHRVTPEILAAAAARWKDRLDGLEVAVLLGGRTRSHRFTPDIVDELANGLKRVSGPVAVTPSRRTDPEIVLRLKTKLPEAWFWDGSGDNPYFAMLALARHIVVTEDSVSMISEAIATGRPVHTVRLDGRNRRLEAFHATLEEQGILRPFEGNLAEWRYEPINETPRVAAEVRRRMGQNS